MGAGAEGRNENDLVPGAEVDGVLGVEGNVAVAGLLEGGFDAEHGAAIGVQQPVAQPHGVGGDWLLLIRQPRVRGCRERGHGGWWGTTVAILLFLGNTPSSFIRLRASGGSSVAKQR